MKYEIDRFDNSEVISYYFLEDKSIVIVYLDEHFKQIPYSKENEEVVLNQMILQAMAREEIVLNQLPNKIKYDFLNLFSKTTISILMATALINNQSYYVHKSDLYKFVYSAFLAFCSTNILRNISNLVYDFKIKKDVIKYHEFLMLKEEIDKYSDVVITDEITLKDILNINTIDYYSLNNIREILKAVKENKTEKILVMNKEK